MKKIMYMAVAVIAALSSCSSEEFAENSSNINNNGGVKVFNATIENDGEGTRSTLVGNTANWESTDKVCINGAVYSVAPVEGNAAKATLTYESGTAPTEGTFKAFYADGANSGTYWDSSTESFKLPASYTYSADKFNMPMYAEGTSTALVFQNICGVLAVKVTSAQMSKVTRVTVTSDKSISGACTISATEGKYSATATGTDEDDKTVILDCGTGVDIDGTGTVFYIPVPAGSHTLRVAVSDDNTEKYMTTSKAVTIARNNIYNITFNGKHEIHFVTIAGLRWSTMNLGATTIADAPETAYGDYYAWGEIATYYTKIEYTDYKTLKDITWNTEADNKPTHIAGAKGFAPASGSTYSYWKYYSDYYNTESGEYEFKEWDPLPYNETTGLLTSDYDVATKTLGGSWRMPILAELKALCNVCTGMDTGATPTKISTTQDISAKGAYFIDYTGTTITINGIDYKVPGVLFVADDSDISKRVFIPFAGALNSEFCSLACVYWYKEVIKSGTSLGGNFVLSEGNRGINMTDGEGRFNQFSIRPVSK